MKNPKMEQLSQLLRDAERAHQPIPPISRQLDDAGDVDLGYAIQRASVRAWLLDGRRVIGRKIGLTNPAVQAQLGVGQPDFGVLFEDMRYASGSVIAAHAVLQPRIEAEVAFILGDDLPQEDPDITAVANAVVALCPALEIVGSRIAEWQIGIVDTIADNASAGAFVVGEAVDGPPLDRLGEISMTMIRDRSGRREVVSRGAGNDCLGSPLLATQWLARELARRGEPLRKGDIVLTGALGPMTEVQPGDRYLATISEVGSVEVWFAYE